MNMPKTINYLPKVINQLDLDTVMNILLNGHNLPHISGIVIDIRRVISFRDTMKQAVIKQGKSISKKAVLEKNEKMIIIDPTTNYIRKIPIRNFMRDKKGLRNELPQDVVAYLDQTERSGFDKDAFITNCKRWIDNARFTETIMDIQHTSYADILLAPYFPIYKSHYNDMLEVNLELARQGLNHAKRVRKQEFGIVICIDKLLLKDLDKLELLFFKYKEIEADCYFLKLDNFNSNSKDENYENIREFFKIAKRILGDNVFFLDMNEFAFILSIDGIKSFSCPMYISTAIIIAEEPPELREGKYIHPENMKRLTKGKIRYLPCPCEYCSPYADRRASTIESKVWHKLRREHWIWWFNEEIKKILDATDSGLDESLRQRFERTIHKDWVNII